MRHLEADPLEAAFDVETFVSLGAIQDTLSRNRHQRRRTLVQFLANRSL